MTRPELLMMIRERVILIQKEDYIDTPYWFAKVIFCGKEFAASGELNGSRQGVEDFLMKQVSKWLDKQEAEERERRMESDSLEDSDNEKLEEYLKNLE